MKCPALSLAFLGLLALPLSLAAMNNKDVIKMQKAGLSEETILAAMQKETPEYETSTDALIELKSAGVSEKIIQTMIRLQTPGAAASSSSSGSSASSSGSNGGGGAFWQEFPTIAPPKGEVSTGK